MYTVRWKKSALNDLAQLWGDANSALRREITAASHTIDFLMQNKPHDLGESRDKGRRITFVPPLCISFRVNDQHATVSILHVRLMQSKA